MKIRNILLHHKMYFALFQKSKAFKVFNMIILHSVHSITIKYWYNGNTSHQKESKVLLSNYTTQKLFLVISKRRITEGVGDP